MTRLAPRLDVLALGEHQAQNLAVDVRTLRRSAIATATAMAKRELNPVTAFMTGRLRVAGNTGLLMRLQGAISQLPDLMADVEVEY